MLTWNFEMGFVVKVSIKIVLSRSLTQIKEFHLLKEKKIILRRSFYFKIFLGVILLLIVCIFLASRVSPIRYIDAKCRPVTNV